MWLGALAGQSQAQLDGFKSRALRVAAPEQRHLYVTEWRTLEMVERAGGSPILVVGEEELCMAGSIRPASSVTYAELATQLGGDGWETVVARIATQRPRSGRIPLSALEVVLALVQAQAGAATVPMVWLLSSGVQAAGSGAVRSRNLLLEPAHAGAWGLARSARAEAQLPLCHLDGSIDRAFELDLALTEPELLLRLDSHLVPRLQHSRLTDGLASRMSTSAGDHLITGGTSGLGLLTGRWLAQGGARCVSLASRSGVLSDTAAEWGVAWASSTAVMSEGVDVGDGLHVHQLLYALPTLTGVWHAAGVLADGILPNQSTLAIAHVYSPKAHAAWALHSTSVVAPLQACVLFSSVASLFGGGGQANYAAANACLDMLATCRRVHGKAATSVQWGPWAEVGMTTRGAARKRIVAMAAMGFGSIIPFQGLAALDTAVRQHKLAVIGVVPVVWSRLLRNDVATPAFLSPFAHTRTTCTITATTPGAACVISLEAVAEMARRTAGGLLDVDAPLMEAGIDSLGAVELRNLLQSALGGGRMVSSTLIFDHPTVRQVVFHLRGQGSIAANMRVGGTSSMLGSARGGPKVVFAGLGMTLPMGTSSMTVLRKMCHCSCDLLRVIPLSRWGAENLSQDLQSSSREVVSRMRYGSFLHEAELFEHDFFRVSAAEALAMDPQQRQLLERGYMALHAAGMAKATLLGSGVAVNVGQWASEFGSVLLHTLSGDSVYTSTGSSCSVTCGRVSFVLGLHGPCASYDTACSASLVSNHGSVRALQRLECDAALSAGVNMILDPAAMRGNAVAGFTSVLGRSHTFDVRADGYARGEAIDAVACELSDAVAAVEMAGSAVRQDGRSASLTAPNGKAQQGVLMGSLADAQLMAQQVTGLEAHGTGTALGDPIETSAVAMVFLAQCSTNALAIGSLKANAGHTEPGAGLAGVLKQLVQLREGDMPPNAQLRVLNPHVGGGMCGHSACLLPMQVGGMSQREQGEVGGVSSFGYSGTIAHAVLRRGAGGAWMLSPAVPVIYRRHAFPWREASAVSSRTRMRSSPNRRRGFPWSEPPHPLIQHRRPLADGLNTFRSPTTGRLHALVADHVVLGRVVFPGAAYLESARAAWSAITASSVDVSCLHGVFFLQPLAIEARADEDGVLVECLLRDDGTFEVRSGDEAVLQRSQAPTHCTGTASPTAALPQQVGGIEVRRSSCTHAGSMGAQYDFYAAVGLQYGPAYRLLYQSWVDEMGQGEGAGRGALGRLKQLVSLETMVRPASLDGALHLGMLVWPTRGNVMTETRLPFAVESALLQDGTDASLAVRAQPHVPAHMPAHLVVRTDGC